MPQAADEIDPAARPSGLRKTPVLVSWSGGKDAAWALHRLRLEGRFEPVALLAVVTEGSGRTAMHGIRPDVLAAQAGQLGLPLVTARQPWIPDNASHEAAMAQALARARRSWPGIDRVAFGDLFLPDVRAYREAVLLRLGWQSLFPLWGLDTAALARDMLAAGLRARVCSVDTRRLDAGFAGRRFDDDMLARLPAAVDPCGENGEFHTLVEHAPGFARPLRLRPGLAHRDEFGFQNSDFLLDHRWARRFLRARLSGRGTNRDNAEL